MCVRRNDRYAVDRYVVVEIFQTSLYSPILYFLYVTGSSEHITTHTHTHTHTQTFRYADHQRNLSLLLLDHITTNSETQFDTYGPEDKQDGCEA